MRADQHDLISQRGITTGYVGDDVVAVAIVLDVARAELDAQRHGMSTAGEPRQDVVLLARHDDGWHGIVPRRPIAKNADRTIAIRARP